MNANDYAREILIPTVKEYFGDLTDRRRMYLACVTTYHRCDFLAPNQAQSVHQRIALRGDALDVIYKVCIGAKHAVPRTRTKPWPPADFRAGDDQLVDPGYPYELPIIFGEPLSVPHNQRMRSVYHCLAASLIAFKAEYPTDLPDLDLPALGI